MSQHQFKIKTGKYILYELFGHVPARVYLTKTLYIDIGRFSYGAISRVRMFNNSSVKGLAASFGDFCEFSDCHIMLGGEHRNNQLNNFNFSSSPPFQALLKKNQVPTDHLSRGVVTFGTGVIVGFQAVILSGVNIGDGAFIGAGAVVSKDCEDMGIYVGNPAKKVSSRKVSVKDLLALASLDVVSLVGSIKANRIVQANKIHNENDKLVIMVHFDSGDKGGKYDFRVLGALIDGKHIPLREGSKFFDYCNQISKKDTNELLDWHPAPLTLEM